MSESSEKNHAKSAPSPPLVTGHKRIAQYLRQLDNSPGVYRMLDEKGAVLYVGKARNLSKRVASYAKPTGHSARIGRMISLTRSMMFLTTETETEALLLEQNLIKQLKPKFNVLLRDDKSFPNIMIGKTHDFPKFSKHRGAKTAKAAYYGPFASAGAVNRTLNQLQKIFLLRNCTDSDFETRTRPCLQYQIARCSAPCVGKIDQKSYGRLVSDAQDFLEGKTTKLQKQLADQMAEAAAAMEFERAAALRDRIRALTHVQSSQGINPRTVAEADVIALYEEGGEACIQVFFIRAHQNWGNRAYFPRNGSGAEAGEILENFIAQFYDKREPAEQVILSAPCENSDLLEDALSLKRNGKVTLVVPQRGERAGLVAHAHKNARESLGRKLSETTAQRKHLQGIAEMLGLEDAPKRIEVYDNSHIQGAFAVGAMIVAGPEGFEKSSYRKFNIKSQELTPGDDFAMMQEVLSRRFKRLIKEDPERNSANWPDLVLIDGGAGQINAVNSALKELGLQDVTILGVAKGLDRDKGKEEFYFPGKAPFALARNDPTLYFIQRLRDEAHRFAIGAHRQKRSKAIGATPLDDVPGIGAKRKKSLLMHFGSAKAVSRAALSDLRAVDGISEAMAETIYNYFHESG